STSGGHGRPRLSGTGTGAHPATPRLSASKPTPAPTEPRPRRAPSAAAPTTWKTTPSGHNPTSEQPRNGQTSGDTESANPHITRNAETKPLDQTKSSPYSNRGKPNAPTVHNARPDRVDYQQQSHRPSVEAQESQRRDRSEEHTSELQSRFDLVCRLLLEKKKTAQDR